MTEAFLITTDPLRLDRVIDRVAASRHGAIATFTGTVRDHHRGKRVTGIEYHAYVDMARQVLADIGSGIESQFESCSVAIHHRVGTLVLGDASVMIAVAAPHRKEALAGCAAAIERVKREAPIWKKEYYVDGSAWIEGRDDGASGC